MTKIDMVNAQVGLGGSRVTTWAFSRMICEKNSREAQVGVWGGAELGWGGGADLGVFQEDL